MTGPGDNILVSWAADLDDLEGQIETLQDAKRDLYATVREEHGKATAAALKTAVKLARMDSEKRVERDEVDAEANRILALIEARAPRATRVATAVPDQIEHHPADLPSEAAVPPEGSDDSRASGEPQSAPAHQQGHRAEVTPASDESVTSGEVAPDALPAPITRKGAPADGEEESERLASSPSVLSEAERLMQRALAKNPRRPHCLQPDMCRSSDPRRHCFSCSKAHADAEGFPA